jgi:formiminoglutamase
MSLSIFFEPVEEKLRVESKLENSLGQKISINDSTLLNWQQCDIAIIGVDDVRGTKSGQKKNDAPNIIRKELYDLAYWSDGVKVMDFGNLRIGKDLDETTERLKSVLEVLYENDVASIIIGGSPNLDLGQYKACEVLNKMINFGCVDSSIDLAANIDGIAADKKHLHQILLHEPNYLFNICSIAYQSYLVDKNIIDLTEKLYYESIRLGVIHDDIKEIEPFIRNLDVLSFDISAIKGQDAPGQDSILPFGLTSEQSCQLSWYAGHSKKLRSIGYFGYQPKNDSARITAKLSATMIWYFIEGYRQRSKENTHFESTEFQKFTVALSGYPSELVFYKNLGNDKWWVQIPIPEDKSKYSDYTHIPCSYKDYQLASNGEIPEKWVLSQSRIQ